MHWATFLNYQETLGVRNRTAGPPLRSLSPVQACVNAAVMFSPHSLCSVSFYLLTDDNYYGVPLPKRLVVLSHTAMFVCDPLSPNKWGKNPDRSLVTHWYGRDLTEYVLILKREFCPQKLYHYYYSFDTSIYPGVSIIAQPRTVIEWGIDFYYI